MHVSFKRLDTGKIDTTESFFSDQFLKSRINSGQESNQGFDPIFDEGRDEEWRDRNWRAIKANDLKYDEDVNHYITLTMANLANPESLEFSNQYTMSVDANAGQVAVSFEETFKKYLLYKINADFLLLNLGLFNCDSNILGNRYFDKGESYYSCAASNLKEIKGGRSGMSDVLEKLSGGFGKYVEILRYMKNSADNFLSFNRKFSQRDMANLEEILGLEVRKRRDSGTT